MEKSSQTIAELAGTTCRVKSIALMNAIGLSQVISSTHKAKVQFWKAVTVTMEILGMVDVPIWLLLIAVILVLYLIYMSWEYDTFKKMGIDGPKPTLVFGNSMAFFTDGMVKSQMDSYKKYGRIFGIFEGRTPVLFIGEPKLLKDIMVKDFNSFVNRRKTPNIDDVHEGMLPKINDDHWRFIRQTITPTFSGKKLRQMTPLINDAADLMMQTLDRNFQKDEEVELKSLFSGYSIDVIARTAFGIELDSQRNPGDPFIKHAKVFTSTKLISVLVTVLFYFPFMYWLPVFVQKIGFNVTTHSRRFFTKVIEDALKERKENPEFYKDFLQLLADAQAGNEDTDEMNGDVGSAGPAAGGTWSRKKLTNREIMSQAVLFFFAGFDTMSNTLSFTMYHLAIHPDICDKVLKEVDEKLKGDNPSYDNIHDLVYLEMCLNETMRIFPGFERVDRLASRDVTVGNIDIPKGMVVVVPVGAIQMDPEYWPNPTKFDPERFTPEAKAKRDPFVFMPFGYGPRNCIGMRLAILESKISLARILQRFRPVRCVKTEVPFKVSKLGNRPTSKGIWVKFEKRN